MLSLKILAVHHFRKNRRKRGEKKNTTKTVACFLPVGMIETRKFSAQKTIAGVGMDAGVFFLGGVVLS
jgi:hypothetical protein